MVLAAALPPGLVASSDPVSLFNRFWFLGALAPVVAALAVASAILAWKGRPGPALLTTTAFGVLVGVLPALAAFFIDSGYPLGWAFLLPLVPTALAMWTLVAAWLGNVAPAGPWGREARSRATTRVARALVGFAALEALVLVGMVLAFEAPCNAASASQTACSTTTEELMGGLCSFVVVFTVLAPILLGLLLKSEEASLLRVPPAGTPPR